MFRLETGRQNTRSNRVSPIETSRASSQSASMRSSGEAATPRAEAAQMKRDNYEPILTKSRCCLLKRRPADSAEEAKNSCFQPEKACSKNLWNFSSRPLAFSFCPDYPSMRCGRITVILPHHAFFRKRAATDLVRDSIRQVADWLRPFFSGSNALEEVASVSGIFSFWKMQTLRSE